MKNPWIVIGVVALVLIGGSVGYAQWSMQQADVGVEVIDHVKGNQDADVVLVEFSDFECPACAQMAPIVDAVMAMYGDSIRFEYRHFPVINRNPQALHAAEAAGQQGKFFEYHDLLFANFEEWTQSPTPTRQLRRFAEELELDIALWQRHMRSSVLRNKIRDDFAAGRELGVTGTPTFFLNGERMNFATFDDFLTQIQAALGVDPEDPFDAMPMTIDMDAVEVGGQEVGNDTGVELEI